MLRALEALGLIERGADCFDARSRLCKLTVEGRSRVVAVMSELIRTFVVANAIDDALRCGRIDANAKQERAAADSLCVSLVYAFAFERGTLAFAFD
jgi:DNA-binding MarR family transcriptional regulator